MTQVTVNGNTYSDDGSAAKDMNEGGFREHFLPMVKDTMADTAGKVASATTSAAAAAVSAASAVSAPGANATSTTSLTVGYGVKALTIQTGKVLVVGAAVQIASTAAPSTVWMNGIVTAYNSGTGALSVDVIALNGLAAVAAAWTVSLGAPGGATLGFNQYTGAQFYAAGIFEGMVDMAAGADANLAAGTLFKKSVTANWALTVSGIPAGASACFILELTNAGLYTFTPPAGTTYPGGIAPVLTSVGTDAACFYKYSGGNWRMLMLGKALS